MPTLSMSTDYMEIYMAEDMRAKYFLLSLLLLVPQIFAPAHFRLMQPAIDAGTSAMAVFKGARDPIWGASAISTASSSDLPSRITGVRAHRQVSFAVCLSLRQLCEFLPLLSLG